MATQAEKINKLDKEVSLIKKDIDIIKNNHLVHLEQKINQNSKTNLITCIDLSLTTATLKPLVF